ncbi:MAG: FxsA family protein, partial [Candidatus Bipolaricaulia bacterium]
MPMLLLALFFAEIAALIKLAQTIGGGYLLLEILTTATLGFYLLRRAGRVFVRTEELVALLANPAHYLRRSGWSLILAGLLLIVPGVLSDLLGVALVIRFLWSRGTRADRGPKPQAPDTIDV